jgi:hypothetical protein
MIIMITPLPLRHGERITGTKLEQTRLKVKLAAFCGKVTI